MTRIVLVGGGNHARYCIDILKMCKNYEIVGIIDSVKPLGSMICEIPVIGRQDDMRKIVDEYHVVSGLVTIGDNWTRMNVANQILEQLPDFQFVNAIHPSTIIASDVRMGAGVVTMAGVIINSGSTVGDHCFLATGAQLEHDSIMGEYSSISAGSVTGGKVVIGKCSAITLGVTLLDRIRIGENTVVGAGSLVLHDIPDCVVAYGSPAVIIRNRIPGAPYLK